MRNIVEMKKTAIIYSFRSVKTAKAADKIASLLGDEVAKVDAETITSEELVKYDNLILGVPTWFDGELPNYWDEFVPAIEELDLQKKKVAIFGNGNQVDYPENFGDAVGLMAEIMETQGAKIVGETSTDGYTFESSHAVKNGSFVGLILDFENQHKLTEKRIAAWTESLKKSFA
jgi:flavodoxin I